MADSRDSPLLICYDGSEDAGSAIERAAALLCGRAEIARHAGLEAEPVAMEATGPVWQSIVKRAREQDAAAIVMGSRGLTGVGSILLGSVSSAVTRHADRPTLVVHHTNGDDREARHG